MTQLDRIAPLRLTWFDVVVCTALGVVLGAASLAIIIWEMLT